MSDDVETEVDAFKEAKRQGDEKIARWKTFYDEYRRRDLRIKALTLAKEGKLDSVISVDDPRGYILPALRRLHAGGFVALNPRQELGGRLLKCSGVDIEAKGLDYLRELKAGRFWVRVLKEGVRFLVTVGTAVAIFYATDRAKQKKATETPTKTAYAHELESLTPVPVLDVGTQTVGRAAKE